MGRWNCCAPALAGPGEAIASSRAGCYRSHPMAIWMPGETNPAPEIGAVVLDWGGVLIEDPAPGLMHACADALGVGLRQYVQVHEALAGPFQEGRITEQEFWAGVCSRLGCPVPSRSSLWGDAFRATYVPRPEMFSLVAQIRRGGRRTALLSNTEPPCVLYFRELGYDMFDVQVFSCVEQVSKPDRRVYARAVERLGVAADRTVFIDDRPQFVEGAEAAGLRGILFRGVGRLEQELGRMGITL